MVPALPLKDVHPGITPSWWPPAPGWWLLCIGILMFLLLLSGWWRRRRRRQLAIAELFDQAVNAAATPAQQVAVMSELLRRAARRIEPNATRLQGEAWLQLLDADDKTRPFSAGAGRLLLEGAYRPDVTQDAVMLLRGLARCRYLQWMRSV